MIHAVGKLSNITLEHVGQKGFPVCNLELDVNGRLVGMSAKGDAAERTFALLGDAPENVIVEVYGDTEYREAKDNRTFMDVIAHEAFLLGNVGDPSATYKVQGFVEGIKEVDKRNGGTFYLGKVREIKFGRDGWIPGAILEVALKDDSVTEWRNAEGQFVFVRGEFSGYKSDQGRIWPRFNADQANFMPVMEWLSEYAPGEAAAVEEADDEFDLDLAI